MFICLRKEFAVSKNRRLIPALLSLPQVLPRLSSDQSWPHPSLRRRRASACIRRTKTASEADVCFLQPLQMLHTHTRRAHSLEGNTRIQTIAWHKRRTYTVPQLEGVQTAFTSDVYGCRKLTLVF